MSDRIIYLDYNATTPVDPAVLEAMLPWFSDTFANAASSHALGRQASFAVDVARAQFAALIGCAPAELVFTSGATEANNTALKGVVEAADPGRSRVLVGVTEHKAVLDTAEWLSESGTKVELIPCRRDGVIDLDALDEQLGDDVALVSVMLANNETGVIGPVREAAELAHARGALFHSDATQAAGRLDIDVDSLNLDLASFSGHKMYGPKGVGALYIRRKTPVAALIHGGGHESGLRSGTTNVPGVVGIGAAANIAMDRIDSDARTATELTEILERELVAGFPGAELVAQNPATGERGRRLPNTLTVRFPGVDGDALMTNAPGVAVSSGSACTARVPSPSHVLTAMFGDVDMAAECIRISVGRPTARDDAIAAAKELTAAARRVHELMS